MPRFEFYLIIRYIKFAGSLNLSRSDPIWLFKAHGVRYELTNTRVRCQVWAQDNLTISTLIACSAYK